MIADLLLAWLDYALAVDAAVNHMDVWGPPTAATLLALAVVWAALSDRARTRVRALSARRPSFSRSKPPTSPDTCPDTAADACPDTTAEEADDA
ncbi:hypothetical protein [Streptomyces sp. NPDC058891]|uniref:hypothetical protein n=1 Tax=Streptomyces sp. NPDC058891 TaxID=3346667 RepID=UPI00369ACE31